MATMAENVITAGSETYPLMLEKGMYDSWKTRILFYIQGKENGEMLIDSIKNRSVKLLDEITVKYEGINKIVRKQTPADLSPQEQLRYDSDIKAVNILLLGILVDIYSLINHYHIVKEIWDRIKELMNGTRMTKQGRESMLYDEFDNFTSEPGESIHSYYLRYAKLINDMKTIPMSMSNMQINTKFVNHLQPEWSRQSQGYTGNAGNNQASGAWVSNTVRNARTTRTRVVRCYNYNGEDDADNYVPPSVQKNDMMLFVIEQMKSQVEKCNMLQATVNLKANHVDAYNSDCDDEATTNAIFMEKLSLVGSLNDDTVEPVMILTYSLSKVISYIDYMLTIADDADNYVPPSVQKNDMMRTTLSPHEISSREQSDIEGAFKKDVIPFSESLKETFKYLEKEFILEVKEMKDIFKQMEDEVDQCSVAKTCFQL
nr:hypothetical protein [Tanacetum cinerariifolium]